MAVAKDGFFNSLVMRWELLKSCPGATASCGGCAAFLHNVVIVHPFASIVVGSFFMNYNATLCKEAWEKKLPAQVTECTCYCNNNCDGNFFRSVGKEWQKKSKA